MEQDKDEKDSEKDGEEDAGDDDDDNEEEFLPGFASFQDYSKVCDLWHRYYIPYPGYDTSGTCMVQAEAKADRSLNKLTTLILYKLTTKLDRRY